MLTMNPMKSSAELEGIGVKTAKKMEVLSAKWMSETALDDYKFTNIQTSTNYFDGSFITEEVATALQGGNTNNSDSSSSMQDVFFSNPYPIFTSQKSIASTNITCSGSSSESSQTHHERPIKLLKTNSGTSASSPPQLLSFNTTPSASMASNLQHHQHRVFDNPQNCPMTTKEEAVSSQGYMHFGALSSDGVCGLSNQNSNGQGTKRPYSVTRTPASAQEHIIAERKRREKLSQRFIALSAIIPGLKKMDKASVLGDAIKYLKQLQERVKSLEEQTKEKTVESVVFVKKFKLSVEDDNSSSDDGSSIDDNHSTDEALPEIEARVADKDVLIRVHCQKHRASPAKILSEVENLLLSVVHSNAIQFGSSTLDITIVARMNDNFSLTVTDLVKNLRSALLKFM